VGSSVACGAVMPRVPDREVDHDEGGEDASGDLSVGNASLSLHPRAVTQAEMKRWTKEDAERDARRITPGFKP
jgi:hypothetical protein